MKTGGRTVPRLYKPRWSKLDHLSQKSAGPLIGTGRRCSPVDAALRSANGEVDTTARRRPGASGVQHDCDMSAEDLQVQ